MRLIVGVMYTLMAGKGVFGVGFCQRGVETRGALKGIAVNQIYFVRYPASAIAMMCKLSQLNAATAWDARNEPVPAASH